MKCPICKSNEVIPIVYGLVGGETLELASQGQLWLGGCIVIEPNSDWHCKNCQFEWYDIKEKERKWSKNSNQRHVLSNHDTNSEDELKREQWRKLLYENFDKGIPDYPFIGIMNDGSVRACHNENHIFSAERDGLKWIFNRTGIGIRSINGKIISDMKRTASVAEIYDFLKSHGRLGIKLDSLLRGRESLFDLIKFY